MVYVFSIVLVVGILGWAWYVRFSIQKLLRRAEETRAAYNAATGDEKERLGRLYNGIVRDVLAVEDSFPSVLVAKVLRAEKLTYLGVGVKSEI